MIKMKDFFDNPDEILTGAALGLAPLMIIHWYILLTAPLCAILYRLGGVKGGDRWWRRMGCSTAISAALFLSTWEYWSFIPIVSWWGIFTLGNGIPSGADKGSVLGQFWFKVFKQDEAFANIATHSTVALALAMTMLPFYGFYFWETAFFQLNLIILWAIINAN